MRQTLKERLIGANSAIITFITEELFALNKDIVEAAKDGDEIRWDVEKTKVETLENFCSVLRQNFPQKYLTFSIDLSPRYIPNVGEVRQYTAKIGAFGGNCGAYLEEFDEDLKGETKTKR